MENITTLSELDLKTKFPKDDKKKIQSIQNYYSIVFDKDGNKSDKVLFLGDVDTQVYEKNIYPIVRNQQYKCIKVAHHGTKTHFSKKLTRREIFADK